MVVERGIVDDGTNTERLPSIRPSGELTSQPADGVGLQLLVAFLEATPVGSNDLGEVVASHEQILRILNDSLQGSAEGLGWVLGGTPEFVLDTRRGLYSYPALQSRLAENTFAKNGLVDFTGPMVRLASLSPEDFYVLLEKLRHVYAYGDQSKYLLPDEALNAFMEHCQKVLGNAYFRTPRTTITAFVNLLAVLEQNPGSTWQALLGQVDVQKDDGGSTDLHLEGDNPGPDDELASFKL